MYARKKLRQLEAEENVTLRARLLDPSAGEALLAIRGKDVPLVEAALRADGIVVSLDEEAKGAFQVRELNLVMWVNPVREHQRVKTWLEDGAPPIEEWKLGSQT